MTHWLRQPESLELNARQLAKIASHWYGQPVSDHRIKRRLKVRELTPQLQRLCYELNNATDITMFRSLPEIQKRLRLRFRQSTDKWTFKGEISFYTDGTVTIRDGIAKQDKTAAGKGRVRGNGSAVGIDALRNVLLAYS